MVFGSANYSKIAPQKSVINAQEFEAPKQLAEYLLYLDKNNTAYAEYFEWKTYFKVNRFYEFFCQLCVALNDDTLPVKTYPNLEEWWLTDSHCVTNITFPWLTDKSEI